jgi:amino acid transporter
MADFKSSSPPSERPLDPNNEDFEKLDPESGVKRGLKTRHLSMMALAGIIGEWKRHYLKM